MSFIKIQRISPTLINPPETGNIYLGQDDIGLWEMDETGNYWYVQGSSGGTTYITIITGSTSSGTSGGGSSGISGSSGKDGDWSGSSGVSGKDGSSGKDGVTGINGTVGTSGTSGMGTSGSSGTSATSGSSGTSGLTGSSGTSFSGLTDTHFYYNTTSDTLYSPNIVATGLTTTYVGSLENFKSVVVDQNGKLWAITGTTMGGSGSGSSGTSGINGGYGGASRLWTFSTSTVPSQNTFNAYSNTYSSYDLSILEYIRINQRDFDNQDLDKWLQTWRTGILKIEDRLDATIFGLYIIVSGTTKIGLDVFELTGFTVTNGNGTLINGKQYLISFVESGYGNGGVNWKIQKDSLPEVQINSNDIVNFVGGSGVLISSGQTTGTKSLTFAVDPVSTAKSFLQLTDVVATTYASKAKYVPMVTDLENSLDLTATEELITVEANFVLLADVPSNYIGMSGRTVQVKLDSTGLEFVAGKTGIYYVSSSLGGTIDTQLTFVNGLLISDV